MTATIRILERLRQQGEFVNPAETSKLVKSARKEIRLARLTGSSESANLMDDYYETTTGLLSIDFFLDTSAATGRRRDEEFAEFLELLGPFRARLPERVRCRLWSIAHLRPRDFVFLLLLGLRSPDKSLLIPISHGVPDARFHTFNGQFRRLPNNNLHRLFLFQDSSMSGTPRNDVCEGSCYHLARLRSWAGLTQGKVYHTTSSVYLLTQHIFDLANRWAFDGGTLPRDFSLFSRSLVPQWYPKNLDGTARTDPFDVTWMNTQGTWQASAN